MENILEKYKAELDSSTNAGLTLARFYCEAMHLTNNTNIIITFNKLLKMYGRYAVMNAIMSVYDMENVDTTNIYGLLAYFCKKEFKVTDNNSTDMTDFIAEKEKQLEKLKNRKITIPQPFEKGE